MSGGQVLPLASTAYRGDFLREVEAQVEGGEWVKMCMQCGVCAGSCPFGPHWEHSPQKIFMLIRAGAREAVLRSDSVWMCTSCYNCVVRCPRKLPITHIMHGLAHHAHRLGLAPKGQPTREVATVFWKSFVGTGRVNELRFTLALYFRNGFMQGVKTALTMRGIGLALLKAGRLNPLELVRGHRCKDQAGIARMLAKARALEQQRRGQVLPLARPHADPQHAKSTT